MGHLYHGKLLVITSGSYLRNIYGIFVVQWWDNHGKLWDNYNKPSPIAVYESGYTPNDWDDLK